MYLTHRKDRSTTQRSHILQSATNHELVEQLAQRFRNEHIEQNVRRGENRPMFHQECQFNTSNVRLLCSIHRVFEQHIGKGKQTFNSAYICLFAHFLFFS